MQNIENLFSKWFWAQIRAEKRPDLCPKLLWKSVLKILLRILRFSSEKTWKFSIASSKTHFESGSGHKSGPEPGPDLCPDPFFSWFFVLISIEMSLKFGMIFKIQLTIFKNLFQARTGHKSGPNRLKPARICAQNLFQNQFLINWDQFWHFHTEFRHNLTLIYQELILKEVLGTNPGWF